MNEANASPFAANATTTAVRARRTSAAAGGAPVVVTCTPHRIDSIHDTVRGRPGQVQLVIESPRYRSGVSTRPTLASVAARAGVSPSTASLAFSGSPRVTPGTRERVLTAAAEL
ncbi:MAG TPA: LacI family DNA-binding transcriptional regulator, partial [Pseudonocardia sp.]